MTDTIRVRKKPAIVHARRIEAPQQVHTAHGMVPAAAGDWIITDPASGDSWPIRNDIFERTYERVTDE